MKAYIVDADPGDDRGFIHLLDLESGSRIRTLSTLYNPDLAVSPLGDRLFVGETDLSRDPSQDYLVTYDARDFRELHRVELAHRTLYNVAPTSSALRVSQDGERCYVLRTEVLEEGRARYTVAVLDAAAGHLLDERFEISDATLDFGPLPGGSGLFFAVSGFAGEAVAYGSPEAEPGPRNFRDLALSTHGEIPFPAVAAVSHGSSVYLVSRTGELRIWNSQTNMLSEPVHLTIAPNLSVPLQHLLLSESRLYLGLAREEPRARGQSEFLYVFSLNGGVFREVSFALWPPGETLALSPDGSRILSLSRLEKTLTVLDALNGERVQRFADVGASPVAMIVVP